MVQQFGRSPDTHAQRTARRANLGPPLFVHLAEAYRKEGLLEDAIRICRDGLDAHASCLSGRLILAKALVERGAFDIAAGECERILKIEPDHAETVQLLEAISAAQEPSRSSGGWKPDPLASPTLAGLYAAQGHATAAEAIYRQLGLAPAPAAGKPPDQLMLDELVALREGVRRLRTETPRQR